MLSFQTSDFVVHPKFVAFDLDDTLVTKSNHLLPNRNQKISEFKDTSIVIISNQKGITANKLTQRFELLKTIFSFPFRVYFANQDNEYRKPNTKVTELLEHIPEFYIGDAAGREGDFSDVDQKFAENLKVTFYTPEEFFSVGIKIAEMPKFTEPTLVLLIGYPAAGKSRFCQDQKYVVSNDISGTVAKSKKLCTEMIKSKAEVIIIDNLNGTKKQRAEFIKLAVGYKVVTIHLNTSLGLCKLRNEHREKRVPDVVFNVYRKNFELPEKDEGIDEMYYIL